MKQDHFRDALKQAERILRVCKETRLAHTAGEGEENILGFLLSTFALKAGNSLQDWKNSPCWEKYAVQTQGCNKKNRPVQAHLMEGQRAIN